MTDIWEDPRYVLIDEMLSMDNLGETEFKQALVILKGLVTQVNAIANKMDSLTVAVTDELDSEYKRCEYCNDEIHEEAMKKHIDENH